MPIHHDPIKLGMDEAYKRGTEVGEIAGLRNAMLILVQAVSDGLITHKQSLAISQVIMARAEELGA